MKIEILHIYIYIYQEFKIEGVAISQKMSLNMDRFVINSLSYFFEKLDKIKILRSIKNKMVHSLLNYLFPSII